MFAVHLPRLILQPTRRQARGVETAHHARSCRAVGIMTPGGVDTKGTCRTLKSQYKYHALNLSGYYSLHHINVCPTIYHTYTHSRTHLQQTCDNHQNTHK